MVNGFWQFGAGAVVWGHVISLYLGRRVEGVSPAAFVFFLFFSAWLSYYFYMTGATIGALTALSGLGANLTWVCLAWYYKNERDCGYKTKN